ncbi:MAG: hypothetical protein JWM54_616, partial [Acidobacteriaceae bacterium]|nr:hypothetical protein [Acidobacteriaceae bacterium]
MTLRRTTLPVKTSCTLLLLATAALAPARAQAAAPEATQRVMTVDRVTASEALPNGIS